MLNVSGGWSRSATPAHRHLAAAAVFPFRRIFFKRARLLGGQTLACTFLDFRHAASRVEHATLLQFSDGLQPAPQSLARHVLHERGHHVKLFDELVDLLGLHAGSGGNPLAAALVDDLRGCDALRGSSN